MDPIFGDACRDYIQEKYKSDFPQVGAWWNRKGKAISIVATNETHSGAILGECSWSERTVGINIFENLEKDREIINKDIPVQDVTYYIFSKSGFTPDLITIANEKEDLLLVST